VKAMPRVVGQDAAKKIKDLTSAVKKYQEKAHRYEQEARHMIAFHSFKEGDLALFLPTKNTATNSWAAFNASRPHYFLQAEDSFKLLTRDWLLARIQRIEKRVATPSSDNPFDLLEGIHWYLVYAVEERTALVVPRLLLRQEAKELEQEVLVGDDTVRAKLQVVDQDAAKKIKDLTSAVKKYQEKAHRCKQEARHMIAFHSFKEGDLALFLPTRNNATNSWAAFNVGCPHYFLQAEDSFKLQTRDWLLARIQRIEKRVATPSSDNPFWYLVHAVKERIASVVPRPSLRQEAKKLEQEVPVTKQKASLEALM
jgi:gamma-glutamyl:cysteine ligase YbdK (ATP-grasp superfamily)